MNRLNNTAKPLKIGNKYALHTPINMDTLHFAFCKEDQLLFFNKSHCSNTSAGVSENPISYGSVDMEKTRYSTLMNARRKYSKTITF
ncbi:unnamed protein product [Heterobilharzia americana]|nr:unnamed protein product [Heterobilharzia americana]